MPCSTWPSMSSLTPKGIGENASQFSADVLARLITPEMKVREELLEATRLLHTPSSDLAAWKLSQ